jgi:hypothetical protein
LGGVEEGDTFRHYDPERKEVIFWNHRINVQAIVREAGAILRRLDAEQLRREAGE